MLEREAAPLIALLTAATLGCSHEVIPFDEAKLPREPLAEPIGLTVAVAPGSFEGSRVNPAGIVDLFARKLKEERIFRGVIFPVPAGARPTWELELSGSDRVVESDANGWKAFLSTVVFPLTLFVRFENDYTLELQALLLHRREVVQTYRATATIRHRYQRYANRATMDAEGIEIVVSVATWAILSAIARDAEKLERLNDTLSRRPTLPRHVARH